MIKINDLKKRYDSSFEVSISNLNIEKGKFVSLLGPNGAGKTTLIKMLCGILEPNSGEILIDNLPFNKDSVNLKRKISVVPQSFNFDKELTVEQNMIFTSKLYSIPKSEASRRINDLLTQFDLLKHKDKQVKNLSGGMKRKLLICRALLTDPEIIFLDEPTVGVDLVYRNEIWNNLIKLKKQNKTILLTTHYTHEAEKLSDEIILISDGSVYAHEETKKLINDLGIYTLEWETEIINYRYFNNIEDAKEESYNLDSPFIIRRTTLEDVFYKFTDRLVS